MKKFLSIKLSIALISSLILIMSCKEEVDYRSIEIADIESFMQRKGLDIIPKQSGLYYMDMTVGTGETAQALDTAEVLYTGYFLSGIEFDSNENDSEPLSFVVWGSSTSMINGFQEAVTYMKEGGTAKVIIPSWLAYGASGYRDIPGFTPLYFELELVRIGRSETAK
jgi:FKBP-type peptidyl-prolyl cis-trans isomerase FkpA